MDQIIIQGKAYDAGTLIGKTLVASGAVSVYKDPSDIAQPIGHVSSGSPVGVIYSWLGPNASYGRSYGWFIFQQNGQFYYTKQSGSYSLSALAQQGVITTDEAIKQQQADQAAANAPWYDNLIRKYGIWIVVTILGVQIIKKKI